MKPSLKRLFARSMTEGFELAEPASPPSPRPAVRKATFVTIAGVLAIIGTLAGGYYFAMRPVVLKIAVGPANSDDLKVVQTLTQAFTQSHGYVRLRPVQTDGAVASAEALAAGKVDLAVIRGDLDVPANAQAVATLRKNFVVVWVPPRKGKKASAKITTIAQLAGHRVGVVGRTQANVNLLKIILQQYAVDPAKVEIVQFRRRRPPRPSAARRRMRILRRVPSTARSPRRRLRHRQRMPARRFSSRSTAPMPSRRNIRHTTPATFRPGLLPPTGPTTT